MEVARIRRLHCAPRCECRVHLEHALELYQEAGNRLGAAMTHAQLGQLHLADGDRASALVQLITAKAILRRLGRQDLERQLRRLLDVSLADAR